MRHRYEACLVSALALLIPSVAFSNGGYSRKIHFKLQEKIDDALLGISAQSLFGGATVTLANGDTRLVFAGRVATGTDLSGYTQMVFARSWSDPEGNTVVSGLAYAEDLLNMADDVGVLELLAATSDVEPPSYSDPDLKSREADAISTSRGIRTGQEGGGPAPEGWFHTGMAIHGSQQAWERGYTGEGVRYMSNDSGADYCHADLHGTWAYIDDEDSPYFGLPQMFDSWSSYVLSFDYYMGLGLIAEGHADYADTSLIASGDFSYTPLGAAEEHAYTVPGTSLSGEYHYGSHPDKALARAASDLSGSFGDGTAVAGERAAVLVVDENEAGVYDTVYVDINFDFVFSESEAAHLSRDFTHRETACLDYDADGLADVSGGLVYFISDGETPVPTADWFWGVPGSFTGNGNLVAFHVQDFTESGGSHGQGTTSTAVGQGVVRGSTVWGPEGPRIAGGRGLVVGPGRDVASTQNGNFFVSPFIEDGFVFCGLGYDGIPGTGDDIQIVSNSWGHSGTDNDGFDHESRLIDSVTRTLAPSTAALFSTGNGAAGYGTVAPPSPSSGIGIGASTLYGSIGMFELVQSEAQIVGGDPMSWSNRGPGVRNVVGVDVVATGAYGTGAVSLNSVLWGAIATSNFGGTSMAAPVAAGNLALIYDAFRARHNRWPSVQEARELLMGTAKNLRHDVFTQGAGLVDANHGTLVAAGEGGAYAHPAQWSVGDYRGVEYPAFAHIVKRQEEDTQTFTLTNLGGDAPEVRLRAETFRRAGKRRYSFKSHDQSVEHGEFTTPDYAFRIDPDIPEDTDLLMARVALPYEQFDPDHDMAAPYSTWRVHLQSWTDLDGDGQFWEDTNGNGKVDVGEMDEGECIRFTYGNDVGPTLQARISRPLERMADGILLTLRHRDRLEEVPRTDLDIEVSYWQAKRWRWVRVPRSVSVPSNGAATFEAKFKAPAKAAVGMHQGAIIASYGEHEIVIPVTAAVAAEQPAFSFGLDAQNMQKAIKEGRGRAAKKLYSNAHVFGYTHYNWRADSGDWRFFWFDVTPEHLAGPGDTRLVVSNRWLQPGTDIDTIVMGPTPDHVSDPAIYGPHGLGEIGRSTHRYTGSGRWTYETSSGGPLEVISAPAREGLHAVALHQVRVGGGMLDEPFSGSVGLVNVNPGTIEASGTGFASVVVKSGVAMEGFAADAFGLGTPSVMEGEVSQDDPNDPSTASFVHSVSLEHAASLTVKTCCSSGSDVDLFLLDEQGYLVAASTTPTDEESVSIRMPEDGTYTLLVHGWSVAGPTDTFELTIQAVQGRDIRVISAPSSIAAGRFGRVAVAWDVASKAPGRYEGLILMGPEDAPGLIEVPVTVDVN